MLNRLLNRHPMRALDIDEITPGMTLAFPVNRNGFLLGRGAKLTSTLIYRLRNAGVNRLCVY